MCNCTTDLLFQLEEQSKHVSQKEDVTALKKQIYDLSMVRIPFFKLHFRLDNIYIIMSVFQNQKLKEKLIPYQRRSSPTYTLFVQGLPLKVLPIVNAGQLLVHSLEWKVILITLGSYCRLCNQTNGFLIAVPVPEAWCKADCQLQIQKEHAKRNSGFSYLIHLVL